MTDASLVTTQTLYTSLSNALNTGSVGGGGSSGSSSTEAFRNLIINGSMIVDQRLEGGITAINSNGDYYICDRFFFKVSTASIPAYTAQRVTVSDADNSITRQNFSIRAQATSNVTIGTSTGNAVGFYHNIEGALTTPLQWGTSSGRTATLSFYIKTNVTGTHWVTIQDALNFNSYIGTFNVPTANTYTRITQTIPAPPSNSVWMTDSNVGVKMMFDVCRGNIQAPSNNVWLREDYTFPSSANSNMWGLSNTYIELAGIQFEVGSSATSFEYRPFSLERTLCQRYYEKSFPEGITPSPKYTARRLWFHNWTNHGNTFFPSSTVGQSNDYNTLYAKYGQSNWMYFYVPSVSVYARLFWNEHANSDVRQTWFSSSTDGVNWSAITSPSNIGIPLSTNASVPCDFYEIEQIVSPQSAPGNAVYMLGSNSANQVPFCTTKRGTPTLTFFNPYSSNGNCATDTVYSSNLAVFAPNTNKFGVMSTESNLWNRNVYFNWAADSEIQTTSLPSIPGLIGLYTGESWTGSQWRDLSGSGNHVTSFSGTISTATYAGTSKSYIYGSTTSRMTFPSAILPSTYTLFYIAKYNGSTKRRILTSTNAGTNWFSGFHGGTTGIAYHNNAFTSYTDIHGTNWFQGTDQNNLYRSDGVDRTTGSAGSPSWTVPLSVNGYTGEESDWAIATVMVYNRTLSLSEMISVERYLSLTYPTIPYYTFLHVYNTGGALTDYVANFSLNYKQAFSNNFQDLRFYDTTTNTLLSHWYESVVNNSNANVWIRVPSLVNGMKIGITVGNSATVGTPASVFPLYEDFSSLNTSTKWTSNNGSFTSASNDFAMTSGGFTYLVTQSNYPGDFVLESSVRSSSANAIPELVLRGNIGSNIGIKTRADCRTNVGGGIGSFLDNPFILGTWNFLYYNNNLNFPSDNTSQRMKFMATNSNFEFFYNNTSLTKHTNSRVDLNNSSGVVGIMNHNGTPINYEWVRGYKSTSNVVTISSLY